MRKPAKLEAEIAALADEVEEVARKRGRALPNTKRLGGPVRGARGDLGGTERRPPRAGRATRRSSPELPRREVTPAAEPLHRGLAGGRGGGPRGRTGRPIIAALRELRPPLADLLVRRARDLVPALADRVRVLRTCTAGPGSACGARLPTPPWPNLDPDFAEEIEAKIAQDERLAARPAGGQGPALCGDGTDGVARVGDGEVTPRAQAAPPVRQRILGRPAVDSPARGGRSRTRAARRGERGGAGRGQGAPAGARRVDAEPPSPQQTEPGDYLGLGIGATQMTAAQQVTNREAVLTVQTRPLADLHPHPMNYRRHGPEQLEVLCRSLREHGQQKPVVIAADGTILAGHGLVEAAQAEGWSELAVHVYDGPHPEAFLAMDNRASDLAEDDEDALAALLRRLEADGELERQRLRAGRLGDTDRAAGGAAERRARGDLGAAHGTARRPHARPTRRGVAAGPAPPLRRRLHRPGELGAADGRGDSRTRW